MASKTTEQHVSAADVYEALVLMRQQRAQYANWSPSKSTTNLAGTVRKPMSFVTTKGATVSVPAGVEIVFWQKAGRLRQQESFPGYESGSAWCTMFDYVNEWQVTVFVNGGVRATPLTGQPDGQYGPGPIPWTNR